MRALRLLTLCGVLLTAGACGNVVNLLAGEPMGNGAATAAQPPGIGGRLEWSGQQSAAQVRTFMVARAEEEWREMWQLAATEPPGPLPQGWMAVGVFLGQRPTGGYGVTITDVSVQQVQLQRDQLMVSYQETVPPPEAMVTQAFTSPWTIRLVRATDAPVRFARAG